MLAHIADHSVDWWLTTEDLPRPENRVVLTGEGDIQVNYEPNSMPPSGQRLRKLPASDRIPHVLGPFSGPASGMDQAGICRFGEDSATTVLNRDCRAHDVDNLYVVDASFMPTMGAVNPTLMLLPRRCM